MIKITDIRGTLRYVNSDLIETIDLIPDTVLVLLNGHRIIIQDSPEKVLARITRFKNRCCEELKVRNVKKHKNAFSQYWRKVDNLQPIEVA